MKKLTNGKQYAVRILTKQISGRERIYNLRIKSMDVIKFAGEQPLIFSLPRCFLFHEDLYNALHYQRCIKNRIFLRQRLEPSEVSETVHAFSSETHTHTYCKKVAGKLCILSWGISEFPYCLDFSLRWAHPAMFF